MRRLVTAALALTVSTSCLSLGVGQAHAESVIADPPTTPAKITVKNPAKPQMGLQPPLEWTAYAQPYGRVQQLKSASNYWGPELGVLQKMPARGAGLQPMRYSLFYNSEKECSAQLDTYSHYYAVPLKLIVPQHLVWMAKNDGVEIISNKCYQIYNGKWIYEYVNFFEMPIVKDPQSLPGRYPKDVPPKQKKYLRK